MFYDKNEDFPLTQSCESKTVLWSLVM